MIPFFILYIFLFLPFLLPFLVPMLVTFPLPRLYLPAISPPDPSFLSFLCFIFLLYLCIPFVVLLCFFFIWFSIFVFVCLCLFSFLWDFSKEFSLLTFWLGAPFGSALLWLCFDYSFNSFFFPFFRSFALLVSYLALLLS